MMRDARNKITAETHDMKLEDLKKYIDNQLKKSTWNLSVNNIKLRFYHTPQVWFIFYYLLAARGS